VGEHVEALGVVLEPEIELEVFGLVGDVGEIFLAIVISQEWLTG